MASAAYAGSRVLNYRDPKTSCGLTDLDRVLSDYEIIFGLQELYGKYTNSSKAKFGKQLLRDIIPSVLLPEAMEYHIVYFGIDARQVKKVF